MRINQLFLNLFKMLFAFIISLGVFAGESFIPLGQNTRTLSDDLLFNDRVLSPKEADRLLNNNSIRLEELAPKENDIWSNDNWDSSLDEAIEINAKDVLNYEGAILSNSGLLRFNVIPSNGNKIYTVHLDKSLHTLLLRKNLLRKLGYKIPGMKYLKSVQVQFKNSIEFNNFLKREIPEATLGASSRWVTKQDEKNLIMTLQDLVVTEPNEYDFYNVAMGVPNVAATSRTMRALVLPYALLDLYESVNKFSWITGKIDNEAVLLTHFTGNTFSTRKDDALWILNKLNKLSRSDYEEIVKKSFYPEAVEKVLIEKLISRRNSLNRLFATNVADINFNENVNFGKALIKGKVLEQDFNGYASRFSYGDAQSPLDQISYYFYSILQSNIISNLMSKINAEFSLFDFNEARLEYYQKQFEKGLNHFVQTGELLPIKVGTWYSPVLSFNLIMSRDIVLGNYLGTDNLVQLADTVGASAEAGMMIGVEGLGYDLTSNAKVSASVVRTYSHVRPVKNLKESMKEPYKNLFVNLTKKSLKEDYFSLTELKNISDTGATQEVKEASRKKIDELLKEINSTLEVGESLILTDRIMPSASVRLNFNQGLIGAGIGVSGSAAVIKRVHLYRKSAKVLQIYDDNGYVKSIDLSFHINQYINLIRLQAKVDKGQYRIKSYMVDLSTDLESNKNFFLNSLGIYNVLKNKNFGPLEEVNRPIQVDVNFKDKTKNLNALIWRLKFLSGKTYYDVQAKDGVFGKYFSYEDGHMSGTNISGFLKQIVNYYISTETDSDLYITDESSRNPGESLFGKSKTKKVRYEASLDENNKFAQKFISYSDIKQGWSLNEKNLKKFIKDVNSKFKTSLFNESVIDFDRLHLYTIGYHMNIYDDGIEVLKNLKLKSITDLEKKYKQTRWCFEDSQDLRTAKCGDLWRVKKNLLECQTTYDQEKLAICQSSLVEKMMMDIDFDDFTKIIGHDNVYVYSAINGLRKNSEILNDTIYSNSIGRIGSRHWNGPIDIVREMLGFSSGEFKGSWMRESF